MKSTLLLSLFFVLLTFKVQAADLNATVISIHDGDTLTALGEDKKTRYKIRLMGVDTPEVDFFNHSQGDVAFRALAALKELAPEGSRITIVDGSEKVDRHGRILGRLLKNGVDINKEMLRQGWGALYFIFPFDKRIVSEYSKSAKEAYDLRRGLFSAPYEKTEMPYIFRIVVRQQQGKNLVGDFESKTLLSPEHIDQIPVWRRVFFPDADMAKANGYN